MNDYYLNNFVEIKFISNTATFHKKITIIKTTLSFIYSPGMN